MKKSIIYLFSAALLTTACSKKNDPMPKGIDEVFV
jgi:hypothetical protein